jgi:hypothetical protein
MAPLNGHEVTGSVDAGNAKISNSPQFSEGTK